MGSIIKVNEYKDFNNNDIITSDGAGNSTLGVTGKTITVPSGATMNVAGTLQTSGVAVGNTPSFQAYLSSNQSVASTTFTKCQFDTKVWDTADCYDNTSNYRYTPNVAGKYFVYSMIFSDGSASGGSHVQLITDIRKNGGGASYATIYIKGHTGGGDGAWNSFTSVDMNGTTDYLEVFGYIRNSGTNNFLANPQYTFFGAYRQSGV